MDAEMKPEYFGPESGTGAGYTWNSKKMGEGKMIITDSKPNELVATRLDFGSNGGANAGMNFAPEGNGVKVTWYFDSDKTGNPLHKLMGVVMKSMVEGQFDSGLNDLKKIAESAPPPPAKTPIKIEATTINDINYLAVRDTAQMPEIGAKIGMDLGIVGKVMKEQKLQMAGAPFVIYYTKPPADFIMDVAANLDKPGKASGKVQPGVIKAGNAVVAHYFGDYGKIKEGYNALEKWIADNNKKIIGNPWEVYVTDPGMEKDTAKWQTDIYFKVE